MRTLVERPAALRAGRNVALILVLARCADPVGLRVADVREAAQTVLNVNLPATWAATVLALPENGTTSAAEDVNDKGVVVGVATIAATPGPHAVRWKTGHPKYLAEPIGPSSTTVATAVSNRGIVVGFWNPGVGENRAVFWKRSGKVTVLAGLAGGASDWAFGVNDAGVIVGQSQNHAARWIDGIVEDLHPAAYSKSRAEDINSAGDIAGWVEYATGERRAYLWHANGSQEELGVLLGDQHSFATGVNDALTVVGNSGDLLSASRAFLWTQAAGIADALLGVSKTVGSDISASGRIVGYREYSVNSQLQAVALTLHNSAVDTLPNPLGNIARAQGVNACGTVVGSVEGPLSAGPRAVVWTKPNCDP